MQLPVDEIAARAREVKPSRVALTLFLGFFWVAGWVAGTAWTGTVMCALAVRRGWLDARGVPEPRHALNRT